MDLLTFAQWFAKEPVQAWGPWKEDERRTRLYSHPNGAWIRCSPHAFNVFNEFEDFDVSDNGRDWKSLADFRSKTECPLTALQNTFDFDRSLPVCAAIEAWFLQQGLTGRWMISWRARPKCYAIPTWDPLDRSLPPVLLQSLIDLGDLLLPQACKDDHHPQYFAAKGLRLNLPTCHHARLQRFQALSS